MRGMPHALAKAWLVAFAVGSLPLVTAAYGAPPATAPLLAFTGLDSSQLPGANPPTFRSPQGRATSWRWSTARPAYGRCPARRRSRASRSRSGRSSPGAASTEARTTRRIPASSTTRLRALLRRHVRHHATRDRLRRYGGGDPGPRFVVGLPSSGCPDQPRLGVSTRVVVFTDDLFTSCRSSGRFTGGEVIVVNKDELLAGTTPHSSRATNSRGTVRTSLQRIRKR